MAAAGHFASPRDPGLVAPHPCAQRPRTDDRLVRFRAGRGNAGSLGLASRRRDPHPGWCDGKRGGSVMGAPGLAGTRLQERIDELAPWFHNLDLDGIKTAPQHFLGDYPSFKWQTFERAMPLDLTGRTVLDIGCNAGFYALEMKRRGAARVVAIDSDPRYLRQAELASQVCGLPIVLRRMSVYEIESLGERFDIVLFMGVLYHL